MKAYIKKLPLVLALGLLCASLAFAQESSTAGQSQDPAPSAQASTVQGCLSGSDGSYQLTQETTGTTVRLMGNEDQLKKYVGHEVSITGELSGDAGSGGYSTAPAQGNQQAQSGNGGSAGPVSMQVTDVKMIARDCRGAGQQSH